MALLPVRALAGVLLCLLAGCASLPLPPPAASVSGPVATRTGSTPGADDDDGVRALLQRPLSPADAARIALARSPSLALALAELGLARADVLASTTLPNPRLSLSWLDVLGASSPRIERGLGLALSDLLLHRGHRRLGAADHAAARDTAAAAIVEIALDAESAWFEAVSARQLADVRALQDELADAAAELGRRYADAGNLPADELAALRAEAAQARLAAQDAARTAERARRALAALLGLREGETLNLPARLPRIPAGDTLPADLAARARAQRLDLAAATTRVERQREALALARRWRLLGEVELGTLRESEPDGGRERGPEIALALPIFHQGQAGIAQAEAGLALAEATLVASRAQLEREVDDARADLLARRAAVETLLTGLLPASAARVATLAEKQAWMLVGPFELVEARGAQFEAWAHHIEAVAAYWNARIALRRAVGGAMPEWAGPLPATLALPPDGLGASPGQPRRHAPGPSHHHASGDTP
jgi:cobalt-zinc-cadmium efflux system outer membrane protein